jgi:hypothetical protein
MAKASVGSQHFSSSSAIFGVKTLASDLKDKEGRG